MNKSNRRQTRCFECGEPMHGARGTIPFPESGLDNVWLANVPIRSCRNRHDEVVIPAPDQLLDVLADVVIRKRSPLVGQEVRFLRKRLGLTAREFSTRLGITAVHLSRLENGRRGLKRPTDLLVRLFCAHTLSVHRNQPCPSELTSVLEQLETLETTEHRLRHRDKPRGANQAEWVETAP